MKKFSFELQKVLEYREFEQKQAEIELAKVLAQESQINQDLQTIAEQKVANNLQIKGHVEFDAMMAHSQYTNLLDYQKEVLLKQLAELQLVIEEKRAVLTECMKKTLALQKLKEKQLNEWKSAARHESNKFLNEVGSQGYYRKNFN